MESSFPIFTGYIETNRYFSPVTPRFICRYVDRKINEIIDKQINSIALSVFEKCLNWVFEFFKAYDDLRLSKMAAARDTTPVPPRTSTTPIVKHLQLMDGTPVEDWTKDKIVSIKVKKLINLFASFRSGTPEEIKKDDICLNGIHVEFESPPGTEQRWGREYNTKAVIIKNNAENHMVTITETLLTGGHSNVWQVDLRASESMQMSTTTGLSIGPATQIYFAKKIVTEESSIRFETID